MSLFLLLSACSLFGYGPGPATTDDSAGPTDTQDSPPAFDCADATFLGGQPDFSSAGTVRGRVTSPSGTVPVSGATLSVEVDGDEAWVVSAEQGCFNLDLPPGSITLRVEKGRYTASVTVDVEADRVVDVGEVPLEQGDLKLAVVLGKYDTVQHLVAHLGVEYDTYATPAELYGDLDLLNEYDAVFSNCGNDLTTQNGKEYGPELVDNVRAWVHAGGTLYTSDWEWELFAAVLPEGAAWDQDPKQGPDGALTASIEDRTIQALLGKDSAEITFDLPDWAYPLSAGPETNTLVSATVDGQERPLALMAWPGRGRMVFTSFHNESQVTSDMELILYELILSLSAERDPAAVTASGVVYQFRSHQPLEGAVVSTVQHPWVQAVTNADGEYTLTGLPAGQEFTPVFVAEGHVPSLQQTFSGDEDVELLYAQLVPTQVFEVLAQSLGGAGLEVDLKDKCHVVTTVSAPSAGEVTDWESFLEHGDAGLLADATASISPTAGVQLYFNEQVLPDPSLTATTTDGGVLWVNLDPGRYTLDADHPDHDFPSLTVDCVAGAFVNASPPHGLTALP